MKTRLAINNYSTVNAFYTNNYKHIYILSASLIKENLIAK